MGMNSIITVFNYLHEYNNKYISRKEIYQNSELSYPVIYKALKKLLEKEYLSSKDKRPVLYKIKKNLNYKKCIIELNKYEKEIVKK